jgi:DNA repair and recombination protein RAD54B
VHPHTACHTHDLIDCACDLDDDESNAKADSIAEDSASTNDDDPRIKFIAASQVCAGKTQELDKMVFELVTICNIIIHLVWM